MRETEVKLGENRKFIWYSLLQQINEGWTLNGNFVEFWGINGKKSNPQLLPNNSRKIVSLIFSNFQQTTHGDISALF